uniref:Uncharacterized protein n=1 Tax=Fagus sylvatica TaxID=28930 RepID=A0A2N9ISC5_FAGSY
MREMMWRPECLGSCVSASAACGVPCAWRWAGGWLLLGCSSAPPSVLCAGGYGLTGSSG